MRRLLKLERLLPLVTILGSAVAVVAGSFGWLELSPAEGLIITLIALMSIDALTERITVLESIGNLLRELKPPARLRLVEERSSLDLQASRAIRLSLIVLHGSSLVGPNRRVFEEILRRNGHIRILLLKPDPSTPAMQTLACLGRDRDVLTSVEFTLEKLKDSFADYIRSERVLLRTLSTLPTSSMILVDEDSPHGSVDVAFYDNAMTVDGRASIHIKRVDDPYWFGVFSEQFEASWRTGERLSDNRSDLGHSVVYETPCLDEG